MSKKYEDIQDEPLMASEPVAAYGLRTDVQGLGSMRMSPAHTSESFQTDEYGRIVLTKRMREALHKAEQSLADGSCLNEEMFQARFAKWL